MRLLLDTHALYWYIQGDLKLSVVAQSLIQDAANTPLVSPASYWEIAIKISVGKWQLNQTYQDFLDLAFNGYGFGILPILPAHTAGVISLPLHHKDPFDRLLIAQAIAENIPLVSADAILDAYPVQRLW